MPFIEANWVWLLIALVVGVAIIWWVWGRSTGPQHSAIAPPEADAPRPAAKIATPPVPAADPPAPLSFAGTPPPVIVEPAPRPAGKKPAPKPEAAPPPAPARPKAAPKPEPAPAAPDRLIQLKGVGPKLVMLLASLGVTRFAEIAAWTDADVERIDAQLGTFKGRIVRDQWIEQARYLAAGDVAGFEAKFGKLDG